MQINELIPIIAGAAAALASAVYLAVNERGRIAEWLKFAVAYAEKLLGGGVGVEERRVAGHHEDALLDGLEDGFHETALARHAHELRLEAFGVKPLDASHELVEEA